MKTKQLGLGLMKLKVRERQNPGHENKGMDPGLWAQRILSRKQ